MSKMNHAAVLDRYELALYLSKQMLDCATREDWDQFAECEQQRSSIMNELQQGDQLSWAGANSAKKQVLITDILAVDVQSMPLARAWRDLLQQRLDSVGTGIKLQKAYQSP